MEAKAVDSLGEACPSPGRLMKLGLVEQTARERCAENTADLHKAALTDAAERFVGTGLRKRAKAGKEASENFRRDS